MIANHSSPSTLASSRCALCGLTLTDARAICPYHPAASAPDWHIANRLQNDALLRGVVPQRAPLTDEEFAAFVAQGREIGAR